MWQRHVAAETGRAKNRRNAHTISVNVNTINTTKLTTNNRIVHQGTDVKRQYANKILNKKV